MTAGSVEALIVVEEIVPTAIIGGDPLFREGLRRILEGTQYHADVIATSLDDAMRYPDRLQLALLLEFPNGEDPFLDALAEFRRKWPNARVVAIAEDRPGQLIAALKAGVHGYLARYISADALLRFLSLIVLGQRIFSTRSLNLLKHFGTAATATDDRRRQDLLPGRIARSGLTEREREMLASLVQGHSNKVIARRLGIAEATVKAQMARLFGKIGAANRTHAAVLAWLAHRASHAESRIAAPPE